MFDFPIFRKYVDSKQGCRMFSTNRTPCIIRVPSCLSLIRIATLLWNRCRPVVLCAWNLLGAVCHSDALLLEETIEGLRFFLNEMLVPGVPGPGGISSFLPGQTTPFRTIVDRNVQYVFSICMDRGTLRVTFSRGYFSLSHKQTKTSIDARAFKHRIFFRPSDAVSEHCNLLRLRFEHLHRLGRRS